MSDDDDDISSIASLFDSICFEHGDKDAILQDEGTAICYFELQQASTALAAQLVHRYRPTHVLLDLKSGIHHCLQSDRKPFVPISIEEMGKERLATIVSTLESSFKNARLVAVLRCDNDEDPMISVLESLNIYNTIFLNESGDLLEPMDVPQTLPRLRYNDDLYILFTSGTSGNTPKAVVGSQSSTLHRLQWFDSTFSCSKIVARRSKLIFVDSINELLSALLPAFDVVCL